MRKLVLATLTATVMLSSCRQPSNREEVASSTLSSGCYEFAQSNSKILMHLEIKNDSVTGKLLYDFYEKDDNLGGLEGSMKGDTLFAQYTFYSEGMESKREVAFLAKDQRLREGYGNSVETDGIRKFENHRSLDFNQGTVLSKTNCTIDSKGCLTDFGYEWSSLLNTCVIPHQKGIRLNPVEASEQQAAQAFVLFSEDQQQAELFLPDQESSLLLQREGEEGGHSWVHEPYKLFPWKGYVLQFQGNTIYAGG